MEVMSSIMAASTESDANPITELLKNGSSQAAVSLIYAMISELNVPNEYVSILDSVADV